MRGSGGYNPQTITCDDYFAANPTAPGNFDSFPSPPFSPNHHPVLPSYTRASLLSNAAIIHTGSLIKVIKKTPAVFQKFSNIYFVQTDQLMSWDFVGLNCQLIDTVATEHMDINWRWTTLQPASIFGSKYSPKKSVSDVEIEKLVSALLLIWFVLGKLKKINDSLKVIIAIPLSDFFVIVFVVVLRLSF